MMFSFSFNNVCAGMTCSSFLIVITRERVFGFFFLFTLMSLLFNLNSPPLLSSPFPIMKIPIPFFGICILSSIYFLV